MQAQPVPSERHTHASPGVGRPDEPAVQGGVEQRRVQPETARLTALLVRQGDFGEHFLAPPPHPTQTLERRTVNVAAARHILIELDRVERHPLRTAGGHTVKSKPAAGTAAAVRVPAA